VALARAWLEGERPQQPRDELSLAVTLASLGYAMLRANQAAEAEPLLRECLAIRVAKQPDDWLTGNTRSMLGAALLGQNKYQQAEPLLLHGYQGMKERAKAIPAQGKVRLAEAAERLVRLYEAQKQPDKARAWRDKLEAEKHRPPVRDAAAARTTETGRAEQAPAESSPPQLADILGGWLQPVDAGERAEFARLCQAHGYNATAARLCKEGFDDLGAPARYLAACAAALAGAGQGKDAAKLAEKERTHWRRQALAWLRPDLALLQKKLQTDAPRWRAAVLKEAEHLQADPRLAAVREPAALARLPESERHGWQQLWQEVEALRKQAAKP
jgi:hypothetical protein